MFRGIIRSMIEKGAADRAAEREADKDARMRRIVIYYNMIRVAIITMILTFTVIAIAIA